MIHDVILFAVGVLVGSMNAIAGGGMLIGFPVLLAFGLSPLAANVTSNIVVMPGGLASAYNYRGYLRKLDRRYLLLLVPCVLGGIVGAMILRNTSGDEFQRIVPALISFAVILFALQPFLHLHLHRHIRGKHKTLKSLLPIAAAIFIISIYGGYFGAGLGFIMLAFLGFTKIHEIHQMTGLKNLATVFISLTSLICLYSTGLVDWRSGLIMAAGCGFGGYYGALLSQKVSSHVLRIIVIIIGVGTAGYLAIRSY